MYKITIKSIRFYTTVLYGLISFTSIIFGMESKKDNNEVAATTVIKGNTTKFENYIETSIFLDEHIEKIATYDKKLLTKEIIDAVAAAEKNKFPKNINVYVQKDKNSDYTYIEGFSLDQDNAALSYDQVTRQCYKLFINIEHFKKQPNYTTLEDHLKGKNDIVVTYRKKDINDKEKEHVFCFKIVSPEELTKIEESSIKEQEENEKMREMRKQHLEQQKASRLSDMQAEKKQNDQPSSKFLGYCFKGISLIVLTSLIAMACNKMLPDFLMKSLASCFYLH